MSLLADLSAGAVTVYKCTNLTGLLQSEDFTYTFARSYMARTTPLLTVR